MTTDLTANYFDKLSRADTPAAVDAVFAEIAKEKPAQRKKILAGIEENIEQAFRNNYDPAETAEIKLELQLAEAMQDNPLAQLLGVAPGPGEEDMTAFTVPAQTFLNLQKARGDKAGPLTQIFSAEAAKLSDAEYASPIGQARLMISVVEQASALAAPTPAPNPFRGIKP